MGTGSALAGPAALLHAPGDPDTAKVSGWVAAGAAGAPGRCVLYVYLFAGTIEANVRPGRPDATAEQLGEAARVARLDEAIGRLPSRAHHWRITGTP